MNVSKLKDAKFIRPLLNCVECQEEVYGALMVCDLCKTKNTPCTCGHPRKKHSKIGRMCLTIRCQCMEFTENKRSVRDYV